MLDAGLNSPFIPECSPIPPRHDITLYSSNEVAAPIPDINIGSQQMSITLKSMEPDIEITARETGDLERIHEREPKKISTPEHLKQPETDHQVDEDEREHLEELKNRKKGKDRQSELGRRVADHANVEMSNRLTEEEMVELRRRIATGRLGGSNMRQAQPSKKSSFTQDEFEDEKDKKRKEEDESGRKTNPRSSPTGSHGALKTFTDDWSEMSREPWKVSSTLPHLEIEDQPTDEEKSPPPKKSPKVGRESQILEVDDLKAPFPRFGSPTIGSSTHGKQI